MAMRRLEKWIFAVGLAAGVGVACGTTDTIIVAVTSGGDTIQLTQTDSIVVSIDTITPGDTTVIVRVDTVLVGRDTVLVQRVDTVVSGVDTVFNVVLDSIIQFDTIVVTTTDTTVVYDTVFVADTVYLPPATLQFGQGQLALNLGGATTISVTLVNALGLPVPTGPLTWISDNTAVARVNQTGTVTGVGVGNAYIYAFAQDGTSGRLAVQVTSAAPQPAGTFRRNLPSGWTTVTDYGFDDPLLAHQDGVQRVSRLGSSGWEVTDWGLVGGDVRRTADALSPYSPGYVLEEVYPAHLSGQGPDKVTFSQVPNGAKVYVSWVMKWDATFNHNTTSEKLIYFNYGSTNYVLFEFLYGVEMMYNLPEAGGYPHLRANRMPPNQFGHGNAPPVNGVWIEYEIMFDQTTGTVQWWKDGVLRGSHTGRAVPRIVNLEIAATWGGGGDKQGVSSRYNDHIFVAVGP